MKEKLQKKVKKNEKGSAHQSQVQYELLLENYSETLHCSEWKTRI